MTIHVDIPYAAVVPESVDVTVNGAGVDVASTTADDCGDLVVKLGLADVKAALEGVDSGSVPVTVAGATTTGEAFSGASSVRVVTTPKR